MNRERLHAELEAFVASSRSRTSIPANLTRLELMRHTDAPCDICGAPCAWAIRSLYLDAGRLVEFLTVLCADHATGFLEGLTDRVGAADA